MFHKFRGKLKIEHEKAIRDNYIFLQEELEPVSVADYLYEKCVFDKDDLEEIRCCKTRKQKATELIDKIQHAGPHDAFEIFLQSLEKEQKHITYRLIKSTHKWLQNVRCPSPQSIQRDTNETKCDPLLLELDRLNKVIVLLKKENEQLKEENSKLAQQLAAEVKEKLNVKQNNIHFNWEISSTRGYSINKHHQCCELDTGACTRKLCKLCDTGLHLRNRLQFEADFDQLLGKLLQSVSFDLSASVWQEVFVFIACANLDKSLKVLIDKGMQVNLFTALTRNAFFFQRAFESFPVKDKLLQYQYKGHVTPLMAAASNGSYKTMKLLLDAGADVNATDVLGDTVLIYLCRDIHLGHPLFKTAGSWSTDHLRYCVEAFISKGADIDAKGNGGMTALMHCAKNGNSDLSKALIDKIPDMSIVCDEGKTVLMYACYYHRHREASSDIDIYIKICDINARDIKGNTALMHCLLDRNIDTLFELLDRNADINIQNNDGEFPLILAIKLDMDKIVKKLMEYRSKKIPMNFNLRDNNGDTALVIASRVSPPIAEDLLTAEGIDLNVQNNEGETALMIAAYKGNHPRLVQKMVDAGANVNIRDNRGRTALHHARTGERGLWKQNAIQNLLKAGAIV